MSNFSVVLSNSFFRLTCFSLAYAYFEFKLHLWNYFKFLDFLPTIKAWKTQIHPYTYIFMFIIFSLIVLSTKPRDILDYLARLCYTAVTEDTTYFLYALTPPKPHNWTCLILGYINLHYLCIPLWYIPTLAITTINLLRNHQNRKP